MKATTEGTRSRQEAARGENPATAALRERVRDLDRKIENLVVAIENAPEGASILAKEVGPAHDRTRRSSGKAEATNDNEPAHHGGDHGLERATRRHRNPTVVMRAELQLR
jgi:hypothetical protein